MILGSCLDPPARGADQVGAMGQLHKTLSELSCEEPVADNQRRNGRVRCIDIACTLGAVLDISASGARVGISGRPPSVGSTIPVTITGLDGAVDFCGQVMWTRRRGLFKFEVGIQWKDLTPIMRQALVRLARAASQNESVAW